MIVCCLLGNECVWVNNRRFNRIYTQNHTGFPLLCSGRKANIQSSNPACKWLHHFRTSGESRMLLARCAFDRANVWRLQGPQNVQKTKTNETKCAMGARLRECDKTSKTYSAMIGCYVMQFVEVTVCHRLWNLVTSATFNAVTDGCFSIWLNLYCDICL
jgi:hypothetical protein